MDRNGTDDPDRQPEGPILDPHVARERHRLKSPPSAGLVYLQNLSAQEHRWMERMVTGVARTYGVNRDDLLQELRMSLLTCDVIDGGRTTLRAWLGRRASWRAQDMRRAGPPVGSTRSLTDYHGPEPAAPEPRGLDPDWTLERIQALGLNRDEAQVVLLVLWGLDVSLREFAALAARNYAKTRQDKTRGFGKIRVLFDLDDEESAALVACRKHSTRTAAATHLGITNRELRARVRRAERKIERALGHTKPVRARQDEGETDAG